MSLVTLHALVPNKAPLIDTIDTRCNECHSSPQMMEGEFMSDTHPENSPVPNADTITFNYVKAQGFRVVHVDGAIGTVTPGGFIHCSIYSERPAMPRVVEHEVDADGTLGPAKIIESRRGFVRELEVSLMIPLDVARDLHRWLGEEIESAEAHRSEDNQ